MSNQAADVIQGLVDIWGNYTYDGKKRYLLIEGSEEIDAGCRVEGHFLSEGQPMSKIYMGNSAKEAYKNFLAAFNNNLKEAREESVAPKKLTLKRK